MDGVGRIGTGELNVALFFPRLLAHSGGVERTLKVMENGHHAGLHFTAFVSDDVIRAAEVRRRLQELESMGRISLQPDHPAEGGKPKTDYDAIVLPSEFWIPAMRRARAVGIRAPVFIEFHQLPYLGTLDVLKMAHVDEPTPLDFLRFPFLASRVLGGSVPFFAMQMLACANSVRSVSRFPKAGLMAVTPVTAKGLHEFGYRGPMFVPEVHVGVDPEPVRRAVGGNREIEFDGVYVGRFHPHKGFLDLPRIVARLRSRWKPDVKIAVCGTPEVERHLQMFERSVDALGVRPNLTMLGFLPRDDLYAVMRRSRMLIYPSYVDAFSITTLESLCLGVPVVAYEIDAVSLLWGGYPGVFLSRVGDPDAFGDLAARLAIESRLDQARRDSERAIPGLLEKFTWPRAAAFERAFLDGAHTAPATGRAA